jgi:creatinine amidohydrolase/Fe(II)-dependent formamide hydrolase-like protein
VVGNAAGATAEKGKIVLEKVVEYLANVIVELRKLKV